MNQRSWVVHGIGLALLALLALVVIPFYAQRIPELLGSQVQSSLLQKGFDWVGVQAEGRDMTVSGKAPNADVQVKVVQTVQEVPGVRNVIDHMTPRIISPYTANMEWQQGQLTLSGFLPDEASYQGISEILAATYGQQTAPRGLQFANGHPENWSGLLTTLLTQVHTLERAQVDLVDQQIHLSGLTPSSAVREQVMSALAAFAEQGYTLDLHIVATDAAEQVCQQKFNQLLKVPILFDSGAARISAVSLPLLKQLAETAMLCPNARITVAGHTDSRGNEATNLKLSEQRARAVASRLFNEGIEPERIEAIGYGASRPIADNASEEGRMKNRRIEFVVQGK